MRKTAGGLLLLLAACSGAEEEESQEDAQEQNQPQNEDVETNPEQETFDYTAPLTGLGTNTDPEMRPVAVMVENSPQSRPQSGLARADIVLEALVEGSVTRQLAWFQSEAPESIGPVRSARDYFIYPAADSDSIFVSAGGSPQAFELIQSGEVDHVSGLRYDGEYFTRQDSREAPHNLYTTLSDSTEAAQAEGVNIEGWNDPELAFTDETELDGEEAGAVEIDYGAPSSLVSYAFDEGEGGYVRSVGGEELVDPEEEISITPRNLLVIEAAHDVIDEEGRREIDLQSGGSALLIQDGMAVEAEWEYENGMFLTRNEDGESLPLLPGRTWIHAIPDEIGGTVSISSEPEE
ncbi:DUF3048 domain-containing protein [Alkalicoccus urumqiensis]|uniref:DUF3048 domain-containing protein n=1 Tax=Alkalicoccus urumqiensis TaxID=1548213 RepID=A0A2P6MIV9_ALKUR|nr:DUF3048 domain-containing protein [Alkalicoccus urumqiensis]PRO66234.1 DUF3048 domain-containing protein [Alkalicoccus urumqiensis]